ncbi:MAG: alpha/beta hydrolase [Flammeovirgaceae bacterium]|nr:MAG: alpha/beta hydrolase [Flammeovirgaceae bacterium]
MNSLIVLHGALGSKNQLDPLCKVLRQAHPHVYSLNFSGHGGKPFRPSFGIETFAEDVLRFLDDHQLKQIDLFGYSMGGYVALWLGYRHPERIGKIVTLGTKFDWSPASAEMETRKLNPKKIQAKVPAFARILEHRHAPNDWKELLQKTSLMMLGLGRQPLLTEKVLQTINKPVTICLGDEDDMADRNYSKKVSEIVPYGRFILLNKTPHPIERVDVSVLSSIILNS